MFLLERRIVIKNETSFARIQSQNLYDMYCVTSHMYWLVSNVMAVLYSPDLKVFRKLTCVMCNLVCVMCPKQSKQAGRYNALSVRIFLHFLNEITATIVRASYLNAYRHVIENII